MQALSEAQKNDKLVTVFMSNGGRFTGRVAEVTEDSVVMRDDKVSHAIKCTIQLTQIVSVVERG